MAFFRNFNVDLRDFLCVVLQYVSSSSLNFLEFAKILGKRGCFSKVFLPFRVAVPESKSWNSDIEPSSVNHISPRAGFYHDDVPVFYFDFLIVRIFQIDYLPVSVQGSWLSNIRVQVGFLVRFGATGKE